MPVLAPVPGLEGQRRGQPSQRAGHCALPSRIHALREPEVVTTPDAPLYHQIPFNQRPDLSHVVSEERDVERMIDAGRKLADIYAVLGWEIDPVVGDHALRRLRDGEDHD